MHTIPENTAIHSREDEARRRVVVIGAGYAGLPAAKRVARQVFCDEVSVSLVSSSDHFVERPRLHQLGTGQDIRRIDLAASTADTPVNLVLGTVTRLHPARRQVTVEGPGETLRTLSYDTLIYALGSRIDTDAVPGVAEHTLALNDVESARRLAGILARRDTHRVAVCGGGLTGIELVTEIAESHPGVHVEMLTQTEPGARLAPRARTYLRGVFDDLGIHVRSGERVRSVEDARVVLDSGMAIGFDLCIWAGGFVVPDLAASAGLEVTEDNRVVVDGTLRSRSHPEVFVVGDAAAVAGPWGDRLTMGCRTGGFTGPKAADAVAAELTGRLVGPLRFRYVHECISLGRQRGLVQFLHADEQPSRFVLTGRKAIHYKNATLNGARAMFRWPGPYLQRRRHHVDAKVAA